MEENENSQEMGNQWETKCQKIVEMLENVGVLDLEVLNTELKYRSKSELVQDINSLSKSLQSKGKTLLIEPSQCYNCGFQFEVSKKGLRIPSKCPKCRQQRISWPRIRLKK